MSLFQLITLSVLGLVILAEVVRGSGPQGWHRLRWVRCLIWLAAAVAITRPDWVQEAAILLGIGRGADVVLYLFVLAFLATTFLFYARQLRQQQEITQLVRHLALREARRGDLNPGEKRD